MMAVNSSSFVRFAKTSNWDARIFVGHQESNLHQMLTRRLARLSQARPMESSAIQKVVVVDLTRQLGDQLTVVCRQLTLYISVMKHKGCGDDFDRRMGEEQLLHPGSMGPAMADGHARYLRDELEQECDDLIARYSRPVVTPGRG